MADQRARPVSRVRARGARRAGVTAKLAGPRRWTGLRRARCAERKGAPTSGVCRSGKGCGTLVRGPLGMLLRCVRAEGTGREEESARSGACWAEHAERGSWASSWVGLLWVGLVSCFLSSSTLFLKQQTKFEFKYNFEFKPHSNN